MALTQEEKDELIRLKQSLQRQRTQPQYREFFKILDEIDLSGISSDDLKALCNPQFTIGVNFKEIDTSAPFTTTDMNGIAPGAMDVRELKKKMSNQSLVQSSFSEIIDTQQGPIVAKEEVLINVDIEDLVTSKTISQGVNLQMINEAQNINEEATSGKEISSRFLEEDNV
jgi:hypothetical protein